MESHLWLKQCLTRQAIVGHAARSHLAATATTSSRRGGLLQYALDRPDSLTRGAAAAPGKPSEDLGARQRATSRQVNGLVERWTWECPDCGAVVSQLGERLAEHTQLSSRSHLLLLSHRSSHPREEAHYLHECKSPTTLRGDSMISDLGASSPSQHANGARLMTILDVKLRHPDRRVQQNCCCPTPRNWVTATDDRKVAQARSETGLIVGVRQLKRPRPRL